VSQLAYLRRKIKSVQTTKKVTHAIRLVSMSLYSKLEKQNDALQYYNKVVCDVFMDHLRAAPHWKSTVLFPDNSSHRAQLIIVVSSSRGLCGSLNSSLFRYVEAAISQEDQSIIPEFITVGTKAYKFIKEHNLGNIVCNYNELNSNNLITVIDSLVEMIMNASNNYSSVVIFGSERRSFFLQRPQKKILIPLIFDQQTKIPTIKNENESVGEVAQKRYSEDVIFEQSNEEILDVLSIGYLRCSLIDTLFQSLLSEHAARFLAMDSSTTNAEKYLNRLTLQYNKARQTAITKEVSELTAGFLGKN
jgi:F-type H+-transporting ATPase subunit gamma